MKEHNVVPTRHPTLGNRRPNDRDINYDILCLVFILTGCRFRERQSPTGHPLILFKGCLLSQERQSKVCVKKIPLNKVDVWNKNWSKVTVIFIFPRVPSI